MAFFKLATIGGFVVEKVLEEVMEKVMFENDPGVYFPFFTALNPRLKFFPMKKSSNITPSIPILTHYIIKTNVHPATLQDVLLRRTVYGYELKWAKETS